VQIRRVRYAVRKATQALTARKVPGAPLLIHKMIECRYRHHGLLAEAARRHSGLPPYLKPPPGATRLSAPLLPPPPGLVPGPGQSTQLDDAADDLIAAGTYESQAPEETEASAVTHDLIEIPPDQEPAGEL
jgi:hypothetical protein